VDNTLTINELKYLKNLINTSGDIGYKISVGSMDKKVDCKELRDKIERTINGTS
jgi:hypothetical protein